MDQITEFKFSFKFYDSHIILLSVGIALKMNLPTCFEYLKEMFLIKKLKSKH